jgi:hypothetical protein
MEAFSQDSRFLFRDFNPRTTEINCEMVEIRPCVVFLFTLVLRLLKSAQQNRGNLDRRVFSLGVSHENNIA